jgi:hypothetical protein
MSCSTHAAHSSFAHQLIIHTTKPAFLQSGIMSLMQYGAISTQIVDSNVINCSVVRICRAGASRKRQTSSSNKLIHGDCTDSVHFFLFSVAGHHLATPPFFGHQFRTHKHTSLDGKSVLGLRMANSANFIFCKFSANFLQIFRKFSANFPQIFCKFFANFPQN